MRGRRGSIRSAERSSRTDMTGVTTNPPDSSNGLRTSVNGRLFRGDCCFPELGSRTRARLSVMMIHRRGSTAEPLTGSRSAVEQRSNPGQLNSPRGRMELVDRATADAAALPTWSRRDHRRPRPPRSPGVRGRVRSDQGCRRWRRWVHDCVRRTELDERRSGDEPRRLAANLPHRQVWAARSIGGLGLAGDAPRSLRPAPGRRAEAYPSSSPSTSTFWVRRPTASARRSSSGPARASIRAPAGAATSASPRTPRFRTPSGGRTSTPAAPTAGRGSPAPDRR